MKKGGGTVKFKHIYSMIIIIVILLTICIGGFLAIRYIQNSAVGVDQNFQDVIKDVNGKDWASAGTKANILKDRWHDIRLKWSYMVDHKKLDPIDDSIEKLGIYIDEHNKTLALSETYLAKHQLGHLVDGEFIRPGNIF